MFVVSLHKSFYHNSVQILSDKYHTELLSVVEVCVIALGQNLSSGNLVFDNQLMTKCT